MGKTLSSGIIQHQLASLERRFLAGDITAKEYQKRFCAIRDEAQRATEQEQESDE